MYTDLSCQTNYDRLKEIRDAYFIEDSDDNIKIRSRIMYGSDYFLNLLQGDSFENYYKNFKNVFSKQELIEMSVNVPKEFLGLQNVVDDIEEV